ncbi:MAG TPA: FAD-dependent monooxygenase [Burkholderiaceae bacterium]|nr:FAD-dependent monooxygenase [Burkholderiaceae bacterium]
MSRIGSFEFFRHPTRVPPLQGGREAQRHRVVIAGGGPVGLGLALALSRWGIASVVIEADHTVCEGSRAICISRRSLEILDQLGVLAPFLAKGLPWEGGRSFYRGDQILHFRMPHDQRQKLPPMINIQQYWIEQFLVEAAQRLPELIDIRWGTEVTGIEHNDAGVALRARAGDTPYSLQADWLVACDGGQSFVRRHLGLKLEGTAFEGKYIIADIELASDYPTERRAWFDPASNPGYTVLMHKQPDDIWRIDYQIPDDADLDEAMQPARVTGFIRGHLAMIGEAHRPWKLVWTSAYRAGAMTLADYRHGRVLFAGNSAHALPIFGVRGLNSGWDDAFNLSWKLAFVLQGWAGERLLDTYTEERIHGYRVNAASAIKSTEFMAPPSRGFWLMREAALSLALARPEIASVANPRQTSTISYEGSSLNLPGDDFIGGTMPGSVPDDCPVESARGPCHLSDLPGPHLTAVLFASDGTPAPPLDEALRALEGGEPPWCSVIVARLGEPWRQGRREQVIDPEGLAFSRCGALEGSLYLLRPDGHVAGRWHRPTAATLQAAVASLCARP